ncbi:MAG: SIS domain-containing protein [Alphaproteobacteria bacterium]
MSLSDKKPDTAGAFADAYFSDLGRAAAGIDRRAIAKAAALLEGTYKAGNMLFCCGNGGSAALANQMVCDHINAIRRGTDLRPRIVSLCSNMETLTATANDSDYADVFVHALSSLAKPGDVLITISSSGDSENIVRAIDWAKRNEMQTVALTGFQGGRSADRADINIHVPESNYGIVEDLHQSITHILAQYIRSENLASPSDYGKTIF